MNLRLTLLLSSALLMVAGCKDDPAQAPIAPTLREFVTKLAGDFPERNTRNPEQLRTATDWVAQTLGAHSKEPVKRQAYQVDGINCENLELSLTGSKRPGEIIVIGAHYDSVPGSPAANDNGSGTAALLYLAQHFSQRKPLERTLRFVAFVNEEPPHFQTNKMGSVVYAKRCKLKGESIQAMLSLETMGYYSDEPGSQKYPAAIAALYPSEGNFLALVGNPNSKKLCLSVKERFQMHSNLPVESAVFPPGLFPQVGWSDNWAFWQEGYPAIMLTDTAPLRYPHYHLASDTADKLDYPRFAQAVEGLLGVIPDLANGVIEAK